MRTAIATVALGLSLAAPAAAAEPPERVYGVIDNGGVETLAFITTANGTVTPVGPIGGLGATEKIVSMDFRPATGQLYALTSDDEINVLSGIHTATPTANPLTTTGAPLSLAGQADIDFNPVADALRIVGVNNENFRLALATNVLAADTPLTTGVIGAGYNNSVAGVQQTTLYDLGDATEELFLQGGLDGVPSPNGGMLTSVGPFAGLTTTIAGAFDISPNSGRAISLRDSAGTPTLYDVSLKDAGLVAGVAPSDATFHAIAIQPAVATLSFTTAAQSAAEDSGSVTLTVRRVGNINNTVNFTYTVNGAGANPTSAGDLGTPTPAGPLAFAPGETTKTITIPLVADTADEPNETFTVVLAATSGGNVAPPATQTVTVLDDDPAFAPGESETAYGVTGANQLVTFSTATPGTVTTIGTITGIAGNVIGIDTQPSTGRLFALTDASRVYVIDKATAAATAVGAAPFTPAVVGTSFGVDFNPVPGAIRLLSSGGPSGQSLRLSAVNGTVAGTDTAPAGTIAAAAYTNSVQGTTASTLYAIDSASDALIRIGGFGGSPSPNGGAVTVVGPLGADLNGDTGFDISGASSVGYVSAQAVTDLATLHRIDLSTGRVTQGAPIGGGLDVIDIAIDAQPPTVTVSAASVAEDAGNATVTVTRSGNTAGASNVTVSTTATGNATAGSDYAAVSAQPVAFAAGETAKTVPVAISDDTEIEGDETIGVSVALAAASPGASLGAPSAATITVFDNDPATVNVPGPTVEVPGPTVQVPGPATRVTVPVRVTGDQVLLIAAPSSLKRATLLRGLKLRTSCAEACRVSFTLKLGSRTLGTATGALTSSGITNVTLRLTSAGRSALRRAFKSRRVRSRKLTLRGTATDSDGGRPAAQSVPVTVTR